MKALLYLFLIFGSSLFAAEVPAAAWSALGKRFAEVREDYQRAEKSYDGDSKSDVEKLEKEALAYLRSLLAYESAVRLLANPKDEVSGLDQIREFSSQERKSIQKLRQEIRDADRERVLEALEDDVDLAGDEKTAAAILKDELRLDSYFRSNTRKLESEISKLERELGKVMMKTKRDDPKRQKVKDEIEKTKEQVSSIHAGVFGFSFGGGFREPYDDFLKGEAASLLKDLVGERERVFAYLKGEQPEGGEGEGKTGTVGGSFLYATDLGVVLDVSGSMTPHLEELREEIESYFEAPRYREVVGCNLNCCHFEHLRTDRNTTTWATMSVVEDLIAVRGVDTVYWFSDLQDAQDSMSLRRLWKLLKRGGTRLHVKSLGKEPSREFEDLIYDFQD